MTESLEIILGCLSRGYQKKCSIFTRATSSSKNICPQLTARIEIPRTHPTVAGTRKKTPTSTTMITNVEKLPMTIKVTRTETKSSTRRSNPTNLIRKLKNPRMVPAGCVGRNTMKPYQKMMHSMPPILLDWRN